MMYSITIFILFSVCVVDLHQDYGIGKRDYSGYTVYEVIPQHSEHIHHLKDFRHKAGFDFWSDRIRVGKPLSIMVAPRHQSNFMTFMERYILPYTIQIEDFGSTVVARMSQDETRLATEPQLISGITFDMYHRWKQINHYMDELARKYPSFVTLETMGRSHEGREIRIMKVSRNIGDPKRAIFVDGGIHAREWVAPAMVLYVMYQLVENFSSSRNMTESVDWYLLPVVNPDGYEYSHTSDRMWRKNRAETKIPHCFGVDCNRNFGIHWAGPGTSDDPCSELYAGTSAFSEPESRAVRDFMLRNRGRIKLYLSFHSYGPCFLYPWGHTKDLPLDWRDLDSLAREAEKAIARVNGTHFEVGSSTNVMSLGSGGSDDYAKGIGNIKYSYTVEMPGGGWHGFDLPPSSLRNVLYETFQGVKVFSDYIRNYRDTK